MKRIRVMVTQKHIDAGTSDPRCCPIALAMRRRFHMKPRIRCRHADWTVLETHWHAHPVVTIWQCLDCGKTKEVVG